MKLDGFGLFVNNITKMVAFYKDILGFEIQWKEGDSVVYLMKDGTIFMMYGRNDFEKMTNRKFEYVNGLNGHFEIALSVPTFNDVDKEFERIILLGAEPVLYPENEPWGQRTCYIADPEGNLIEIGSFNNENHL